MKLNIKEIFRWITFIPVPLIAGPLASALLLIPLLYIPSFDTLIDIPTKIILTGIMWIVIYWVGAFLKPRKLPMSTFRIIWIVLITLSVSRFLIQNSFYDWRYQLLEIIIPLSFFSYRGDYPDHETFMRTVNLRIANVLGFLRERKLIGYFGWSLPTEFFALYLFLEVIFLTFNSYPFAILSFVGAVALNTAVNTTLYSKDPEFKKNPFGKYSMALFFVIIGLFLVRISGLNSISVLNFSLNLYILPCLLGLTYYPGNEPKDFE